MVDREEILRTYHWGVIETNIRKGCTGDTRENPHGVGFYFLLASAENSGKKPIPYRFFRKLRGFFIIEKSRYGGWGFIFC